MSKTKTANLSSDLVAVKGTAAPSPDVTGRAAGQPSPRNALQGREEIVPLNFRIPASLRREFKTYAACHDMKLNELLRVAFEAYRRQQGD